MRARRTAPCTIPPVLLRQLAVRVLQKRHEDFVSIAFAALDARDGSSTVAASLASVLRDEMGQRVAVVPTEQIGRGGYAATALAGPAPNRLPPRAAPPDPVTAAHALPIAEPVPQTRLSELKPALSAMRTRFDVVLLDCEPLAEHPETALVAASADGLVLVLRADRSERRAAKQAVDLLRSSGVAILGVVLNQVPRIRPRWLERML